MDDILECDHSNDQYGKLYMIIVLIFSYTSSEVYAFAYYLLCILFTLLHIAHFVSRYVQYCINILQ